ncbi:hypothetical protein PVK06_040913 [Gossypium arboreum]|uniref:NADP-dependent oxidoreductase domain-containing protein n=1 Tax=Gossypium arboreum TaxID=29729 RepID=A0ABR0N7D9_GOSAR|nr:hypothetical protein PVK06_040913 [Gossypium arboreum]
MTVLTAPDELRFRRNLQEEAFLFRGKMAEQHQGVEIPRVKLGTRGLETSLCSFQLLVHFKPCLNSLLTPSELKINFLFKKFPSLGFGCLGLSAFYNDPVPDEVGISIIKHAFARGITFFDTSDIYGPQTNEILVGKALKQLPREKVQLATKFGIVKTDPAAGAVINGTAGYVRPSVEASLKRLDVDYIDLYYQHRVDTKTPIEDTMGELKKLVEEGKIKYIGLSEASPETIRRAHVVHPVSALQMEWSLWSRDIENEIIPLCRELGIGIVPYSPLGRGFFGGRIVAESVPANSYLLTEEDLKEITAVVPLNEIAGSRTLDRLSHLTWKFANTLTKEKKTGS